MRRAIARRYKERGETPMNEDEEIIPEEDLPPFELPANSKRTTFILKEKIADMI